MENNEVFVLTGKDPFYHERRVLGVYHDMPSLREAWDTEFEPAGYFEKDFGSYFVE